MEILCGSYAHVKDAKPPLATVAIIYHDNHTQGGTVDLDPQTVMPGAYGTETAYLCAACAGSSEVKGSVPATVIRTMAL